MKPKSGDILLVVPLKRPLRMPKITLSALFGLGTTLTWNAAHVAVYGSKVIEQTLSHGLQAIEFDQFVNDLSATYKQFWIYILRPKHATRNHNQKLLKILAKYEAITMPYHVCHAIKLKLLQMTRQLTRWGYNIAEPFELFAGVCSTFAAFVLKQAGIDIGRRSSLAFTPGTFLKSKKFTTVRRILYTEGSIQKIILKKRKKISAKK